MVVAAAILQGAEEAAAVAYVERAEAAGAAFMQGEEEAAAGIRGSRGGGGDPFRLPSRGSAGSVAAIFFFFAPTAILGRRSRI
jgi:hypothetical protein